MRERLLIAAGAVAIAIVVPTAMAVTRGAHVVCESAAEQFSSGAFITAVEPQAEAIEPGPNVCVTFPEWYSADEYRTVEVTVGHAFYDRRLRLAIDAEAGQLQGGGKAWVGGRRGGGLTTVHTLSVRASDGGFDSTPGVSLPPVEPWIDEIRLHIELDNPRDGVLYTADVGGDVRSRLGAALARMRMALLPTAVLLALYLGAAILWVRAGPPPELPPDAQDHYERPIVSDLTGQQQMYQEGLGL